MHGCYDFSFFPLCLVFTHRRELVTFLSVSSSWRKESLTTREANEEEEKRSEYPKGNEDSHTGDADTAFVVVYWEIVYWEIPLSILS